MEKQLTDYFDTHDLGDALEQMPEAHFDVNIQRKTYLVSVDEATMKKLVEIAQRQRTSTDILVNDWLKEKASAA